MSLLTMSLERYFEIWSTYQHEPIEEFAKCVTEDAVWEEYEGAPGAQVWHGPEGMLGVTRRWQEDFDGFGFEPAGAPEELEPDVYAIPVRVFGTGRASGLVVDWQILLVTRMRDGLVAHLFFADTMEEARERL